MTDVIVRSQAEDWPAVAGLWSTRAPASPRNRETPPTELQFAPYLSSTRDTRREDDREGAGLAHGISPPWRSSPHKGDDLSSRERRGSARKACWMRGVVAAARLFRMALTQRRARGVDRVHNAKVGDYGEWFVKTGHRRRHPGRQLTDDIHFDLT